MCNSVAATFVDDAKYERAEPRFETWFTRLGAERFTTFMCDSVAAALHDQAKHEMLLEWEQILGNETFVRIASLKQVVSRVLRLGRPFAEFVHTCPRWTQKMSQALATRAPGSAPIAPEVWVSIANDF